VCVSVDDSTLTKEEEKEEEKVSQRRLDQFVLFGALSVGKG